MSAITDFKDKLVEATALTFTGGSALAAGTNLFIGRAPSAPDNAVQLMHFPTAGPERKMGAGTAGVAHHNVMIQVIVRSSDYSVMQDMCAAITARMDNFTGSIGANRYLHILMRAGWMDLGHDESKRFRQAATFMMKGPVL
jgi:hypothetical protein